MDILRRHALRIPRLPTTALLLASASLVALSSMTAAAPPQPTASIDGGCINDSTGDGNFNPVVDIAVDVAHKGRWVDFEVTVSVDKSVTGPTSRTIRRHDSRATFADSFNFLTVGERSDRASVAVRVVDKKGTPVGGSFTWSEACAAS